MKNFPRLAGRLLALSLVLGSLGFSSCKKDDTTTTYGNWVIGNPFPGAQRGNAVSFVINNIAYVGTGVDASSNRLSDFYSFDPSKNSWQVLTPFPGVKRNSAVAFTAGSYGYVGSGYDGSKALSDFWRFNPKDTTYVANGQTVTTRGVWKRMADMPLTSNNLGVYNAVAAGIGNFGYVGCGTDGLNVYNFFYKYDPSKNTWTSLTSGYPGDKSINATAFTINNVLYVGTGTNNGIYSTRFYAYDPAKDTWTAKSQLANISNSTASYDNSKVARTQAVAFTIGNFGYVTTGSNGAVTTSTYKYDPSLDTWTAMNPFLGSGRNAAVGFGIGNLGYVGTGNSGATRFDDFWTFDPNVTQQ